MLTLIACNYETGWSYVGEGDKVILITPPFKKRDVRFVSEWVVDSAVLKHGFTDSRM